jgi:hypothetical protein
VQLGNAFAGDGAFGRQQAAEAQLIETVIGQPRFGIGRAAFAERAQSLRASIHGWRSFASPGGHQCQYPGRHKARRCHTPGSVRWLRTGVIFIAADEGRAELNFTHRDADIRL